jgi:hypothetical protein
VREKVPFLIPIPQSSLSFLSPGGAPGASQTPTPLLYGMQLSREAPGRVGGLRERRPFVVLGSLRRVRDLSLGRLWPSCTASSQEGR